MIDLNTELPISLTEACRVVPRLDGKRPVPSTIWRWCRKGLRGVYLEHIRLGHRVATSREALARFSQTLAEIPLPHQTDPNTPKTATDRQRAKSIEAAESVLESAGIVRRG